MFVVDPLLLYLLHNLCGDIDHQWINLSDLVCTLHCLCTWYYVCSSCILIDKVPACVISYWNDVLLTTQQTHAHTHIHGWNNMVVRVVELDYDWISLYGSVLNMMKQHCNKSDKHFLVNTYFKVGNRTLRYCTLTFKNPRTVNHDLMTAGMGQNVMMDM